MSVAVNACPIVVRLNSKLTVDKRTSFDLPERFFFVSLQLKLHQVMLQVVIFSVGLQFSAGAVISIVTCNM